jgi:phosphatidylglycerophosphate synthase
MKIPNSQENPIDVANIWIADKISPAFRHINLTANHITTLSLIFGIIALVFLYHRKFFAFAITYYISYFFDCMDGFYARKYNLVSKIGDYYDHIKDIIVALGIMVIMILRYKIQGRVLIISLVLLIIFTILMLSQLGCQEKLYPHNESPMLNGTKYFCPGDAKTNIKFTRWFGCGTWTIIMLFIILYININQ